MVTIAGPSLKAEHNPGKVMAAVEVGPSHMPSFVYVLSMPEIRSVAQYVTDQVANIPISGGNFSEGGILFRETCAPMSSDSRAWRCACVCRQKCSSSY